MISNARGKHSSPGVYIDEIEKPYASKSLGITSLGVVGETLKGPAFEPVHIDNWTEFQEYFGGTSTEKFKETGYPKYELPYIAKSYLQESNQLEVCRVLGFSGYDAGPAWVLHSNTDEIIAVLRSKASYGETSTTTGENNTCNENESSYGLKFLVKKIETSAYQSLDAILNNCQFQATATTITTISQNNYGKFTLVVTKTDDVVENIPISLNPNDKDYIINVLGMNPHNGAYSVFVEEYYDLAHMKNVDAGICTGITLTKIDTINNYKSSYRSAVTPWFVSEIKGGNTMELNKLFRFHTISDGNAANSEIKISIANLLPEEGLFDVQIRDFNDTDSSPIILERFNKCNMLPGSSNYIGLKIGTYNGEYSNKSKYVTVEVIENEITENSIPCGFLGYPLRKFDDLKAPSLKYNTSIEDKTKANRQYFGMSTVVGVDLDVLTFKGSGAYHEHQLPNEGYTNGFHLDSFINITTGTSLTVDGVSGYTFDTPEATVDYEKIPHISTEEDMKETIYADKRMRKFTCYPYGGFDGWDIYRTSRTNTDDYRANKYKYKVGDGEIFTNEFDESGTHGLVGKVINSDYYAYLAGYKQFDNPSKVDINIFATPGIDYVNNAGLVAEVLDIIEDSRKGDCLYVVTTPDTDTNGFKITPDEAVVNFTDSEINTSYAATYYPWVKYYDSTNKKYINLPVTKDVVRNFAYTDNVSQPWFASAGMSRGNVDCVKANHFTKLEEEDNLYENMINPVKTFSSDGVKIWGNKTMYLEDTPLNRINVRRLMIRLKKLVISATKQLIFEQNDNTVEAQFRSIVGSILANAKQNRGISDYKIQTDTSAEARDRKELPARIWVKPINSLEYISISFVVTPEGANFED